MLKDIFEAKGENDLVKNLIPAKGVTVLFCNGRLDSTSLIMQLAQCINTHASFLDQPILSLGAGVICVNTELLPDSLIKVAASIGAKVAKELCYMGITRYFRTPETGFYSNLDALLAMEPAELVIINKVNKVLATMKDQPNKEEKLLESYVQIANKRNCAILVVAELDGFDAQTFNYGELGVIAREKAVAILDFYNQKGNDFTCFLRRRKYRTTQIEEVGIEIQQQGYYFGTDIAKLPCSYWLGHLFEDK